MSVETGQLPDSNAPSNKKDLFYPLSIASVLLGVVLLFFWLLMGLGEQDLPDIGADSNDSRRWVLLATGASLCLLGLGMLIYKISRSRALGTGRARLRLLLNVVLMVVLGSMLLVLVNYVFARHEIWRLDLTGEKVYTLSDESITHAKALTSDIRVVVLMPRGPQREEVERLLAQYKVATARISALDYNTRTMDPGELRELLETLGLDPDLRESEIQGLVVESGQRDEAGVWVREHSKHIAQGDLWQRDTSNPQAPMRVFYGERLISSAIRDVTQEVSPKIYFLTGHGEKALDDFEERTSVSRIVKTLRTRGYTLEQLGLLERERVDVPKDCSLLMVLGPRKGLTDPELDGLRDYLDQGGRAIFFVEAWYRKGPDGGTRFDDTGLEVVLEERFGVEPLNESVFLMFMNRHYNRMTADHQLVCHSLDPMHAVTAPLTSRGAKIAFYSGRPVQLKPLTNTDQKVLVSTKGWGSRCFSTSDPALATQTGTTMNKGPFSIGVAVEYVAPEGETKRQNTRVAVFGDVEWITNQFIAERAFSNLELFLNTVNWCIQRDDMMVGEARRPPSYKLNMSAGTLDRIKLLAFPGMPFVALLLGVFAFLLRGRN
jgi:ABC-2 type transport system permease protein